MSAQDETLWRCSACGDEFDTDPGSSHAVHCAKCNTAPCGNDCPQECGPILELDGYGNPTDGSSLPYCCFPDCGCDGSRLCMAESGASDVACRVNLEGMYRRSDAAAQKAKLELLDLVHKVKP